MKQAELIRIIKIKIHKQEKETKQLLNNFSEITEKHLTDQDKQATANVELLETKIKILAEQNEMIKKEIKTNRLIQIFSTVLMIGILIYVAFK